MRVFSKKVFLSKFIRISIILLGFISLILMQPWAPAFSLSIIEALFFCYACGLCLLKINKSQIKIFYLFIICFAYVALSYVYAVIYNGTNIFDFLLVYKSFIYLLFLYLIINKKIFSHKAILNFINIIFIIFIIKYTFVQLFYGFSSRPQIFIENNFELMLLCSLCLLRNQITKKNELIYLLLLGLIIILSFSRSAILMYGVLFIFIMNQRLVNSKYKNIRIILLLLVFIIISYGIQLVFYYRALKDGRAFDLQSIDRYRFFQYFLYETRSWNFFNYFIGAPRITELSNYTCNSLSFYSKLLSYSEKGNCYSVIFHSFIIRTIFDHGIIGLFFILFFTYKILILSDINKWVAFVFIAMLLLNGLSVSSFNSVFFPISLLFFIGTKLKKNIDNY